jgi:hypothetical protein
LIGLLTPDSPTATAIYANTFLIWEGLRELMRNPTPDENMVNGILWQKKAATKQAEEYGVAVCTQIND